MFVFMFRGAMEASRLILCMLATPAVVAGVEKIVVVTPPNEEGNVDNAILAGR